MSCNAVANQPAPLKKWQNNGVGEGSVTPQTMIAG
jgi:hypothetical protein